MSGLSGYARVIRKKLGQLPLILAHLKVNGYTSRGNNFSPSLPTFSTGVSSYRKVFAPQEQILSFKSIPQFLTGFAMPGSSQEVTKVVSLRKKLCTTKRLPRAYILPLITSILKFKHLDFAVPSLVKFKVAVTTRP